PQSGSFGVVVYTRVHTPRFCGLCCRAGTFFFACCVTRGLRISWLMVGIRLACNPSSPLGLSGDANGFVPARKTEERLALPVRSALTRFTEDRACAHARRSCTSHLTVVRKAASELHWSRLVTPIRSRKRLYLNGLAGFGHAVPSKRSSPPAEKWAVCIGGSLRSQGKESR